MRLVERALCQHRRSKGVEGAEHDKAGGLRFGDLVAMPDVRALLEDDSPDLTRDAILARLTDMIPSLVADWHKECKSRLVYIGQPDLRKVGVPLPEDPQNVDLAIMSFRCGECLFTGVPLRWPKVLEHWCLRDAELEDHCPPPSQVYETEVWEYLTQSTWTNDKWDLRKGRHQKLCLTKPPLAAITACGLDPATATAEEMDKNGARFMCQLCSVRRSDREVYDWTGMVGVADILTKLSY